MVIKKKEKIFNSLNNLTMRVILSKVSVAMADRDVFFLIGREHRKKERTKNENKEN